MKTRWTCTISGEFEVTLDLEDLWPDAAERPETPTVDDVKRELFGQSPSRHAVTRALQDMDALTFGVEDVTVCIFQPVEVCDECKRLRGRHSELCSKNEANQ